MTYCVGLMLDQGLLFAADGRGDGAAESGGACKLSAYERVGDRVIVILSSGGLASTEAVCRLLRLGGEGEDAFALWRVGSILDLALLFSRAIRDAALAHARRVGEGRAAFDASFILGGQVRGEAPRLFRVRSGADVVEAGVDEPYLQIGETTYGKPMIEWLMHHRTSFDDAASCVLASFDSTMRNDLTVATPIDLLGYRTDSLAVGMRRRFEAGSAYFANVGFA